LYLTHPPDLSAALHRLFQALTVATPYLLILDDMQWADAGFWALADAFAALHSLPFLVVLAYRRRRPAGTTIHGAVCAPSISSRCRCGFSLRGSPPPTAPTSWRSWRRG
jgi:hypothetical protein